MSDYESTKYFHNQTLAVNLLEFDYYSKDLRQIPKGEVLKDFTFWNC